MYVESAQAVLERAKNSFAAGDMVAAERLCRSIIVSAPELAGPWIVLADIDLGHGDAVAAIEKADGAIALEPENPFAYFVRCKSLLAAGRLTDAVETAELAVGLKHRTAATDDGFGSLFLRLKRYERALAMFTRAVAADPDNTTFLYHLATAERALGELDSAERHLDRVIVVDRHYYDAYYIRADLRKQTDTSNHLIELQALVAEGVRGPRGQIAVHYALGKEYEDLNRFSDAFRHFKSGADLQRRRLRYDGKGQIAVVDRIIRSQTSAVLDSLAQRSDAGRATSDNPIFIVGLPRSGTTLVERIIGGHSRVFAAGEIGTLPSELIRAARNAGVRQEGEWVERLPSIDLAALGHAYSRVARENGIPSGQRVTEKFPPNVLLCGVIRLAFPDAKIIAMRRRPLDVCFALFKTLFNTGIYPYSYDLKEVAEYYAAHHRLNRHWRDALPADRLLEVSYEDLVNDLEGQSRRILRFLDLPWEESVLRFHESSAPTMTASAVQVRQPLYSSAIGRWRHYREQLEPLRARLAELLPTSELDLE